MRAYMTLYFWLPLLLQGKLRSVVFGVREKEMASAVRARYVYDISFAEHAEADGPALESHFRAQLLRLRAQGASPGADPDTVVRPEEARAGVALTFDVVLHTAGVACGEKWVPARGAEVGEMAEAAVVPVLDADDALLCGLRLGSRIEVPFDEK